MPKTKIITQHTYKPGNGRENIEQKSMTQPGHARTIKDILTRYQETGEIPGKKDAE